MKTIGLTLAVVVGLVLTGGLRAQVANSGLSLGAWGNDGQDAKLMAKVCELTPEQQQKLADLTAARRAAIVEFNQANGEKIKAASAALQEAIKSNDAEAIAKTRKEYSDLYAPLMTLWQKSRAEVMAVLTPEQKAKWQEYNTMTMVKAMYARANLTEEQQAKLKTAYDGLIKNGTEPQQILSDLRKAVDELLTPEQKEAMTKVSAGPGGVMLIGGGGGGSAVSGQAVINVRSANSGAADAPPAAKPASEVRDGGDKDAK